MKIVLDTTNKTIKIEESVNLGELIDMLDKLLPNVLWRTFKLETSPQIIWNSPIYIRDYPHTHPYIEYPWYAPSPYTASPYTMEDPVPGQYPAIVSHSLQSGTYCIEG